jgi:hypothetical protein
MQFAHCRAAKCGSTVQVALSCGTLPALVHSSLVQHRIAIQGMSPPVVPSMSITCGGLVARLGMLGQSDTWPHPPDMQQPACTQNVEESPDSDVVDCHPREYEFIISVIDVHGAISSRLDTEHHAAASVCYDMNAHFDVEAGFKQGRISSLLQGNELSQIKEAHEAAGVPWMHPADDEAILASLRDNHDSHKHYMNEDQKLCAPVSSLGCLMSTAPASSILIESLCVVSQF